MRIPLLLLLCVFSYLGFSQVLVQGIVIDSETKKPLAGASVFISNTSVGTVASADGSYELRIPPGTYEIVFSAVGYQTKVFSSSLIDSLNEVNLLPKIKELEDVVVKTYDKNGWQNWGQFFLEYFIGRTQFSDDCKLNNHSVLRFYFDKTAGIITITAKDVLNISNEALGYNIKYQLEQFTYDTRTKILRFEGYPLFEQMQGPGRKMRKWERNRKEAYEGSLMHFMRALYQNKLKEAGFEVHKLKKIRNLEKDRIRKIIRIGKAADSSKYYDNILSQPDEFDVMNAATLTGDSIAYAVDSFTVGLSFNDYLDVTYTKKNAHPKYLSIFSKAPKEMTSQLTMVGYDEVLIQYTGSYLPAQALLALGYWSWSEKIATMLPFDYKPY